MQRVSLAGVPTTRKVNVLLGHLGGILRGEVVVEAATYADITYGYGEGASENWPRVAACADFGHLVHGHATSAPPAKLHEWARRKATATDILEGEGSVDSPVYGTDHTFRPMVGVWGCLRVLAGRGDAEAAELAGLMRSWLRAVVLNLAKLALPVRSRSLTDAQAYDSSTFRPGVIVSKAAPHSWSPVVSVAACGKRGWDISEDSSNRSHWPWYVAQSAAGWTVAEFGLGVAPGGPDCKQAEAIRERFGLDMSLFSADERGKIRALIELRDLAELRWALAEIGDRAPADRCREVCTTEGKASVNLRAPKGPTSCRVAHSVDNDGTNRAMGVDSPHRGTGASRNRPHVATVDMGRRLVVGTAEATDYDAASRVEMALPGGEVVWDFEWGGGAPPVVYVGGSLFGSGPGPEPDGELVDLALFFNQTEADRRTPLPHPYPVVASEVPGLWVLLKGLDPDPFAAEGFAVDERCLRLRWELKFKRDEQGYITGVDGYRMLRAAGDPEPGAPWWPRFLRRDGTPVRFEQTVRMVGSRWPTDDGDLLNGYAEERMVATFHYDAERGVAVRRDRWADRDPNAPDEVSEEYLLGPKGLWGWSWTDAQGTRGWSNEAVGAIQRDGLMVFSPSTPRDGAEVAEWVGVLGARDPNKPAPVPSLSFPPESPPGEGGEPGKKGGGCALQIALLVGTLFAAAVAVAQFF